MPQAILFDVDGTLVDSNHFHVLAWAEVFHAAGHDFRLAQLHDEVGQGADNYVRALLPDIGDDEAEELGKAHGRVFGKEYLHRVRPFAGAHELLQRCKDAGLKVMLASSANAREVKHHLQLLDAEDIVDGWTSADDVGCSKPCPDLFEAAARKAGVASSEALVVGDTPFDVGAADAAGIRTVAVRSGLFSDKKLSGAVAIYDNVADLLARFEGSPLNPA